MKYIPINDFLLIEKKETAGLVVSGQDDDANATMHGIVVKTLEPHHFAGREIVFVRGQARKIKLEGKDYFIIKRDKVLLYVENDT